MGGPYVHSKEINQEHKTSLYLIAIGRLYRNSPTDFALGSSVGLQLISQVITGNKLCL